MDAELPVDSRSKRILRLGVADLWFNEQWHTFVASLEYRAFLPCHDVIKECLLLPFARISDKIVVSNHKIPLHITFQIRSFVHDLENISSATLYAMAKPKLPSPVHSESGWA